MAVAVIGLLIDTVLGTRASALYILPPANLLGVIGLNALARTPQGAWLVRSRSE